MKYAVMSALSFGLDKCRSRSHCPSDLVNRKSTMFSKPPIVVEPSRRAGSSSVDRVSKFHSRRPRGHSV